MLTEIPATATDDDASATATETDDDDATDTATMTATESAAPTSTGAVVEVDLKNATIGDNAELIKVDGKPAMYVYMVLLDKDTLLIHLTTENSALPPTARQPSPYRSTPIARTSATTTSSTLSHPSS